MIVISHAICSYLLALGVKARFVHPRNVRVYFNISKNNYKKNKQASIDLIPKLLSKSQIHQANINRFSKRDDCAEALILAFYAAKNYALLQNIENVEAKRSASCAPRSSANTHGKKRKNRTVARSSSSKSSSSCKLKRKKT